MAARISSIGTQTNEKRLVRAPHPGFQKIAEMRQAYENSVLARKRDEKAALDREIATLRQERDRLQLETLQLRKENEQAQKLRDLLDESFLPKPAPSPDWFGHRALDEISDEPEAQLTDPAALEASCLQTT